MKAWAIIATIFLIASLCLNVWYYTETTNLNASIKQQLGYSYYSKYQLPFETMSELWSNIGPLVYQNQQLVYQNQQLEESIQELSYENQQLEYENQQYEATLTQIQQEAERAQEYGTWQWLLEFIWSLL